MIIVFFFFGEWSYTGVELVLTKKLQTVDLNNIKDWSEKYRIL